jgi:hypothetical protein
MVARGMMIDPSAIVENVAFGELLEYWMELNDENDSECLVLSGGNRKLHTAIKRRDLSAELAIVSPYKLIPANSTFYHYDGGLTTPPWYVCVELIFFNTWLMVYCSSFFLTIFITWTAPKLFGGTLQTPPFPLLRHSTVR